MTFPFVWPANQLWLTLLDLQLSLCLLKLRANTGRAGRGAQAMPARLAFEFIYCVECWLLKMHSTVICIKYTYECSSFPAALVYPFFDFFFILLQAMSKLNSHMLFCTHKFTIYIGFGSFNTFAQILNRTLVFQQKRKLCIIFIHLPPSSCKKLIRAVYIKLVAKLFPHLP